MRLFAIVLVAMVSILSKQCMSINSLSFETAAMVLALDLLLIKFNFIWKILTIFIVCYLKKNNAAPYASLTDMFSTLQACLTLLTLVRISALMG